MISKDCRVGLYIKLSTYGKSVLALFYTEFRTVSRVPSLGKEEKSLKVCCASELHLAENKWKIWHLWGVISDYPSWHPTKLGIYHTCITTLSSMLIGQQRLSAHIYSWEGVEGAWISHINDNEEDKYLFDNLYRLQTEQVNHIFIGFGCFAIFYHYS